MPKHCEIVLYQEDISKEKIQEIINNYNSIKQFAYILHDRDTDEKGELKKAHFHIYLNFGNTNVQFESISKWFGCKENMVNKIKTDKVRTIQYFLHLKEADKFQYSTADMVTNMNIDSLLAEDNKREKLSSILQMCGSGIITRNNVTTSIDVEVYAKHASKINKAFEYYEQATKANTRALQTLWFWGKPGTGKTTLALKLAESNELTAYQTSAGRDPFSLYSGEKAVVLNELRPNQAFSFGELLQLIDPHYCTSIPSRYYNKVPNYVLLVITSSLSPEQYAEGCELSADDSPEQLFRRIAQVWEIGKEKIICSGYSSDGSEAIPIGKFVNPVNAIIAEKKNEKVKLDLSLLGEPLPPETPESIELKQMEIDDFPF